MVADAMFSLMGNPVFVASFATFFACVMNGQGTGKCSESKKTLENHGVTNDFDASKKQMSVTDERAISENQRYKNDEMITVREEILPWCAETMAMQICVAQSAINQNRKIDLKPF